MSSYFITTLGCPKNTADSREMERSLQKEGFAPAVSADKAELHLINSCAFIEDARLETIRTVLDAAQLKGKKQKLILVGCFTERYAAAVSQDLPEVDFSFGTGKYAQAGQLLREKFGAPRASRAPNISGLSIERAGLAYAPVKISDGCDRTCSFCAIPQFRGSFRSTPIEEILAEAHDLAARGVREICLVSQDSNAYGGKPESYLDLLERLHEVEDLSWIRMLYMYPDKKTEKILQGIASRKLPKLVPYLESPVQHGSAKILRAMRRAGDPGFFADLFALAREAMPGAEVRTSILMGFPGETEEDVEEVLRFLEHAGPEKLALFSYSPEEGTSGAALPDAVSQEEAAERINRVREYHRGLQSAHTADLVGQNFVCMVDESQDGELIARRPQDAPEVDGVVYIENSRLIRPGELVNVQITGFTDFDLTGMLI